jgi:CRISPR-associated protein Csb1
MVFEKTASRQTSHREKGTETILRKGQITMSEKLNYELLHKAISGNAAAIRCKSILQPAAGEGTKVFPPTHSGGVYATEQRRLPIKGKLGETQVVDCVLLDSVQSQANRIEDALQQAIDEKKLAMPLIVVNFGNAVADVQRVTSLQAPHRAADAILRDSLTDQKDEKGKPVPFRKSDVGKAITDSSLANATGLFRYCPHALFLGVWDSTGPKGGLGAKFARALVSEIVGIDSVIGKKTSSRIDPLQARAAAKVIKLNDGSWKLAENDKAKGAVSPSEINHGNIPPDVSEGSATIAYAEHTAVLSLPQLRRLRFPVDGKLDSARDSAARTVLAALALVGLTLSLERGSDLRSRCLLFPEGALNFELLEIPGKPTPVSLDSEQAIAIYNEAVKAVTKLGLPWETAPIMLTPSPELIALVKKSQELAAVGGDDEKGEA